VSGAKLTPLVELQLRQRLLTKRIESLQELLIAVNKELTLIHYNMDRATHLAHLLATVEDLRNRSNGKANPVQELPGNNTEAAELQQHASTTQLPPEVRTEEEPGT